MRLKQSELERWGTKIGQTLSPPVAIALSGPLGAGKSVLARAIGRGAGVDAPMPSPTYNILLRYDAPEDLSIVHIDLYRLDSPDEVWELGWSDLGAEREVVLIEWPERAADLLPEDHWLIELAIPDDDPTRRDVAVHRVGNPSELAVYPLTVSTR